LIADSTALSALDVFLSGDFARVLGGPQFMAQNPMVLHHVRRGIAGKSRMNLIGHIAKWVEFTRTLDEF
jgi:hypothetical protein